MFELRVDPLNANEPIVYLMRGLPSSGKSTMALRLAGGSGSVFETDEFFYTQVGENPASYDYDAKRLGEAREWNFRRFQDALVQQLTPVVVDRGNGRNHETRRYVELAHEHGYHVELREPESPWWLELRVLLKFKHHVSSELLDQWAEALANRNRETHRAPKETIRRWMEHWKWDLTIDEILKC